MIWRVLFIIRIIFSKFTNQLAPNYDCSNRLTWVACWIDGHACSLRNNTSPCQPEITRMPLHGMSTVVPTLWNRIARWLLIFSCIVISYNVITFYFRFATLFIITHVKFSTSSMRIKYKIILLRTNRF